MDSTCIPAKLPCWSLRETFSASPDRRSKQATLKTLLRQIASSEEIREFQSSGIVLCYHHLPGRSWFAVLAFREQGQIRLDIRSMR